MRMMRTNGIALLALGAVSALGITFWSSRTDSAFAQAKKQSAKAPSPAPSKAYRFELGGWTYLHLEGTPAEIGKQHGSLLAVEIKDAFEAVKLRSVHDTQRQWEFFRKTAREMLWPKIDAEYQEELRGIAEGVQSRGVKLDVDDIVALNAFEEVPDYYVPWLNKKEKVAHAPRLVSPGNCSAFVATGRYTKDHQIVIAHNNWTSYLTGQRWRIIFDIVPQKGHRILMDGFPGVITSDDDFGVNVAGLMVTETTITQFEGWDPNGKPEFVRSRKALQYASSIDDYVKIMLDGNNGGYANDWLLGDRKTGEIARFELGLKNHKVWRTKDGYFVGSNFASDPKLITEETKFDTKNSKNSPNARKARWEELMKANEGKIDVNAAQQFMSDHHDTAEGKEQANERTLCGHTESTSRGIPEWEWGSFYPGGAVQGKVIDSKMAEAMSFVARVGHPCGADFIATQFLKSHPEYKWQSPKLVDMKAGPWTKFSAGQAAAK
ncbi:MAG: peptidase C45 [Acidobacteria bacterium]|nr:peptidase C45 [Acidobacteriota bacterium]